MSFIYASACRPVVCLGHVERIFLSFIFRKVAAAAKKRHLQTAGDDDPRLRDVRDRRKVGVEVVRDLSVRDGVVPSAVGIYAYILI